MPGYDFVRFSVRMTSLSLMVIDLFVGSLSWLTLIGRRDVFSRESPSRPVASHNQRRLTGSERTEARFYTVDSCGQRNPFQMKHSLKRQWLIGIVAAVITVAAVGVGKGFGKVTHSSTHDKLIAWSAAVGRSVRCSFC